LIPNENSCPNCGGTGWVTILRNDREYARKCRCQEQNYDLRRSEKANIPDRFIGYELKTYYPHKDFPSQQKIIKRVERFIQEYPAVLDSRGLLFQGRAGVGKTHLICAIATELMKKFPSLNVYYIDWNNLVHEMRTGDHFQTRDFSDINSLIDDLAHKDLLLFDELGGSDISNLSQWILDSTYYIFNKRYNNQKITLCATNFFDKSKDGQPTLSERLGERIRSRLFEMTETLIISGPDRRQEV